jgi:hypothetical protein
MPRKAKTALYLLATRLEVLAFIVETQGDYLMRHNATKDLPASDLAQISSGVACTTGQFVYAVGTILRQIANELKTL